MASSDLVEQHGLADAPKAQERQVVTSPLGERFEKDVELGKLTSTIDEERLKRDEHAWHPWLLR